jgi:hypothetical protein
MNTRSGLTLLGRSRLRPAAVAASASALALTGVTLSSAPAANAASCPVYHICTWQNANYSGTQWNYTGTSGQPRGYWWYVGNAANDQISSIFITLTSNRAWFDGYCTAGSGEETWMPPGAAAPNLANNYWPGAVAKDVNMNDSITAWAITPSGTPAHGSTPDGGC